MMSMQPNHEYSGSHNLERASISFVSDDIVSSVLVARGTSDRVMAFHAGFSLGPNQLEAVADTQSELPATQIYIPAYPTRELPLCDSTDEPERLAHISSNMTRFTQNAVKAARQHLRHDDPISSAPHSLATMGVFGGVDGRGNQAAIHDMNGDAAIIAGIGMGMRVSEPEFALRCIAAAGVIAGGLATEFSKEKLRALRAGSGGLTSELSHGLLHTPRLLRLLGASAQFDIAPSLHAYSTDHRVDVIVGQKDVLATSKSTIRRRNMLRYGTGSTDYHVWRTENGRHDFPAGDPTMLRAAFALLSQEQPKDFIEI